MRSAAPSALRAATRTVCKPSANRRTNSGGQDRKGAAVDLAEELDAGLVGAEAEDDARRAAPGADQMARVGADEGAGTDGCRRFGPRAVQPARR